MRSQPEFECMGAKIDRQQRPVEPESNPAFHRFMARLPVLARSTFTDEQLAALAKGFAIDSARHLIDYRASVRLVGQAYYVRLLVGPEKRKRARLVQEGQIGSLKIAALVFVTGWLVVSVVVALAAVALYVLKSALGIDLMDGPSILHDLFFN